MVERCVVDNRVFLLGLDQLYREAMKSHERDELLRCARVVAGKLRTAPFRGPVEGYYADDRLLTAYFRLMRGLQAVPGTERERVAGLKEFQRLWEVTSSPLFGCAVETGGLFQTGRDPLAEALRELADTATEWSLATVLDAAHRASQASDDYSLVGLAALARDPVVLTALRESVVLYVEMVFLEAEEEPRREFVWQVDDELAQRAARFVETFNRLFGEDLPQPAASNAERFWDACDREAVVGRCVAIGKTPPPTERYYHWAICGASGGQLAVHEFWADEPWTTKRYRESLPPGA